MIKRVFILVLIPLLLFFIPSSSPRQSQAITGTGTGGPKECKFELEGGGVVANAAYASTGGSITVTVSGGRPNAKPAPHVKVMRADEAPKENEDLSFDITPDSGGNATHVISLGSATFGEYKVEYDKFSLFQECDSLSPNDKTFFLVRDGPLGTKWMTVPEPVTNADTTVSIYIIKASLFQNEINDPYQCLMVKSYGPDNGARDPGWTGAFASQANGGSLCNLDEGEGDICDTNPHKKGEGENCVKDEDWGAGGNDFLQLVTYTDEAGNIIGDALEIRGICESMEGIRSKCADSFNLKETYTFAIYGVDDPPEKGTETDKGTDFCEGSKDETKPSPTPGKIEKEIDVDTCDVHGALATYELEVQKAKGVEGEFPGEDHIQTPFGDIPVNPAGIALAFLNLGIGAGGGLAFLLMVFGSYRLIFAGGDPESIQKGKQVITAAIAGLLVIIFATFILRLFGIGILGLPIPK